MPTIVFYTNDGIVFELLASLAEGLGNVSPIKS
jgi:hypothetical protein